MYALFISLFPVLFLLLISACGNSSSRQSQQGNGITSQNPASAAVGDVIQLSTSIGTPVTTLSANGHVMVMNAGKSVPLNFDSSGDLSLTEGMDIDSLFEE